MMMSRNTKTGLKPLLDFWGRYQSLDNFHYQWAKDHLKIIFVKRHEVLELSASTSYFVAKGLLARVEEDPLTLKRKIMSLALPNMALLCTVHLYSQHIQPGKLVALRSGILVSLPHTALRQFQADEKSIDTLIDIFSNKEKRQLALLREATMGFSPFDRYLNFARLLPEIKAVTTQIEQADLLNISRDTVQQAQYFLATAKIHRKKHD